MNTLLLLALCQFGCPGDATSPPAAIHYVDLTHDGALDQLRNGRDGSLEVAVHDPSGRYQAVWQELPRCVVSHVLASDLDGDGWVDLYLVSPAANLALLGDGSGRLRPATTALGLDDSGWGLSAERIDADQDGLADILLLNASGEVLFRALPGSGFERVGSTALASGSADASTLLGLLLAASADPSLLGEGLSVQVGLGEDGTLLFDVTTGPDVLGVDPAGLGNRPPLLETGRRRVPKTVPEPPPPPPPAYVGIGHGCPGRACEFSGLEPTSGKGTRPHKGDDLFVPLDWITPPPPPPPKIPEADVLVTGSGAGQTATGGRFDRHPAASPPVTGAPSGQQGCTTLMPGLRCSENGLPSLSREPQGEWRPSGLTEATWDPSIFIDLIPEEPPKGLDIRLRIPLRLGWQAWRPVGHAHQGTTQPDPPIGGTPQG